MPVVMTVEKDKLTAEVNNRSVYSWQGDFVQNKLKRRRGQSEEPLQLGGVDGDFVFENVTLEPLDSSAKPGAK